MRVLGIESSCDETGVAVYDSAKGLIGHQIFSQVEMHAKFGGVVPELASRDHIRKILPLIEATLEEAGVRGPELDGVAYTAGPGLIGALLVGGTVATGLAMAWGVPAIPVHHMEAHLLAPLIEENAPDFPFVALLVSGGHSMLVDVAGPGQYEVIGESLDDAAGEAFDKTAKLLGLGYPGGPALAKLADQSDVDKHDLPRPMLKKPGLDMSFSGLKTAVMLKVRELENTGNWNETEKADLANSFQDAVVETLVKKSLRALEQTGRDTLIIAGGVGANRHLRASLEEELQKTGRRVFYPRPEFCTDNGAMVAHAGLLRVQDGQPAADGVIARARWPLNELSAIA